MIWMSVKVCSTQTILFWSLFGYVEPGGTVGNPSIFQPCYLRLCVHDSKNVLLNIDQQLIVCFNKY